MISLGLDISSTSTGFIALQGNQGAPATVLQSQVWAPPAKLDVLDRSSWHAERLLEALASLPAPPGRITIEAVGGGKFAGAFIPIVMTTTVLKYFLRQSGHRWDEVANSQLKKYVGCSGKGAGGKDKIALEVFKRWAFEHPSNDVIDAFVLAKIGLALGDCFCTVPTSYQKEVIAAVRKKN